MEFPKENTKMKACFIYSFLIFSSDIIGLNFELGNLVPSSSIYLPSVPTDHNWDKQQTIESLSIKLYGKITDSNNYNLESDNFILVFLFSRKSIQ